MTDVIYYDNAATSWPKPPVVGERMQRFLAEEAANPGRAGHRMAVGAEKMLDAVRKQVADLVHGSDLHRVIFTLNATDALNIAFKGILRQGDHVITTWLEHNSVSRPLQAMADAGYIDLTRVAFSQDTGVVDPDEIRKSLRPNTRLVAMTHASNVVGTVQPVAEVGRIVREAGGRVRFLLDAAQTLGVVPVDVPAMHLDFVAFPGHKSLLGPTGTGGLYVGERITLDELIAFREGGTGGDSSSPTQPRLFPYFLEGGTPNTVGIAGLGAALDYGATHDAAQTLAHERAQVQAILDAVAANPRVRVYGPPSAAQRVGTLIINVDGYMPQEAGSVLDESFSIAVRPGLHCAPYAHRVLGTFPDGALRISPGHFNTAAQLATLLDALQQMTE